MWPVFHRLSQLTCFLDLRRRAIVILCPVCPYTNKSSSKFVLSAQDKYWLIRGRFAEASFADYRGIQFVNLQSH